MYCNVGMLIAIRSIHSFKLIIILSCLILEIYLNINLNFIIIKAL